jgi:hypothetical protein
MMRGCRLAAIVWLVVVACGSSSPSHAQSPPTPVGGYLTSLGSPGCVPPAAFHGWQDAQGFPEVGLDSRRGSVWALFFSAVPPPARQDIKIVWRMTGSGDFSFRAIDAAGVAISPVWGPESHGGSNWEHPGDEVGTAFNFTHPGCWDIHVGRSDTSADLWLQVSA